MTDFNKLDEKYYRKAKEFALQYGPLPSRHVLDIMVNIMGARDGIVSGGHFVQAIIDNNLTEVINRGDNECISNIKLLVATKLYCHLR